MNARFDAVDARFDAIERCLDRMEARSSRIEDKVEALNQNYIQHLAQHNKKE
jgi:tetrahydromethanopterin S-methyltransferase subunit G